MAFLKVITGPMFSGKSEALIHLIHRAQYAHKNFLVLKPALDSRQNSIRCRYVYSNDKVITVEEIPAVSISNAEEFWQEINARQPERIFIDEAQFFGPWLVGALELLLLQSSELRIYVAGLDQDAWGKSFGPMAELMTIANKVKKLTAICFSCKKPATKTFKGQAGQGTIEVGDLEIYEARCRQCWHAPV